MATPFFWQWENKFHVCLVGAVTFCCVMDSFINFGEDNEELYLAFRTSHEARLRFLDIPECKWRALCRKLNASVFDAGHYFVRAREEASGDEDSESVNPLRVYTERPMSPESPEDIYLIDHAWTYTAETAKKVLEEANYILISRLGEIMKIPHREVSTSDRIKMILDRMWMYNNCYIVQNGDKASSCMSCWYVLDEFGSRIRYVDEPSFKLVPFFFSGDNSMYSLLLPISNISAGEEVTVAYPGYKNTLHEDVKKAIKYPWVPCDLSNIDFNLVEPSTDYFASGRQEEVLPERDFMPSVDGVSSDKPLTVYSCYTDVIKFLKHPSFKVVDNKEEANILWLSAREYNIRELVKMYPNFCFINQIPSEHILINKDLLAVVCRRCEESAFNFDTLESHPDWLPTTFNLKTELAKFVSYFQSREKRNLDNIWICKPFNLARGMDIHVTDNVSRIIRLSTTRPMVACKYITDPVLFPSEGIGLVKMDLRYIVLLSNTDPLELYVYDRFWIRFSNKPFNLEDLDDYEKHFTVMNYSNFPLQQMFCHHFIEKFEAYYTSHKWSDIQEKINTMIKDIFVAATSKEPPAGLGKFGGSRAVYGLDIMLKWDRSHDVPVISPMILEVNWMPDCKRACQYYPEFYDDVFSVLFLGDTTDKHVTKL